MTDSEKGPLEQEIWDTFEGATKFDPTIHGVVQGRLTDADIAELGIDERNVISTFNARMFGIIRKSLAQLASEIDTLNAASDSRDDPADPA